MIRGRMAGAALVLALATPPAAAAPTRFWDLSGPSDLLAGEIDGLSLVADGELILGPDFVQLPLEQVGLSAQPFLWTAVADREGNLYVGSGVRGVVYRVTPDGAVSRFFTAPEIEVHALAVDPEGRLLVGSSPAGRVYRVEQDGSAGVLFEPLERYIWDLAPGAGGSLLVATGERGVLYRVGPDGEAEVLFDSDEPHLVSVAMDRDGSVVTGSSGSGIIYRIDGGGRARVLLDTDGQEAARVALLPDGTIYAAVNTLVAREKRKEKGDDDREPEERLAGEMPAGSTPVPEGVEDLARRDPEVGLRADGREPLRLRSTLWRIPVTGAPAPLWDSPDEGIHSLRAEDQRVFFGTGIPGRLYVLEDAEETPRLLARFPESQVTALARGAGGVRFVGGSNPGRLYRSVGEFGESGEFLSPVLDAGASARWGQIGWRADAPPGSRVEVATRSGDSARPDNTWSEWSPAYARASGSPLVSPAARYLQVRARLSRLGDASTPRFRGFRLSYREANLPPRVSALRTAPPGEGKGAEAAGPPPEPHGSPREIEVRWTAEDPNGDRLSAALFLRPDPAGNAEPWREIASGIEASPYRWDTAGLPAGRYRLQVRVTDAPDNDELQAREARDTSATLVIDRDPPQIVVLAREAEPGVVRITFRATDAVSPVVRAVARLDGGPPRRATPTDGLDDGLEETYEIEFRGVPPGRRAVELAVRDLEGNTGTATLTVEGKP